MLLYSTLLNIKDTMTKEAFIELVIEWKSGEPPKREHNFRYAVEWGKEYSIWQ